jgi:hypothetical protein
MGMAKVMKANMGQDGVLENLGKGMGYCAGVKRTTVRMSEHQIIVIEEVASEHPLSILYSSMLAK